MIHESNFLFYSPHPSTHFLFKRKQKNGKEQSSEMARTRSEGGEGPEQFVGESIRNEKKKTKEKKKSVFSLERRVKGRRRRRQAPPRRRGGRREAQRHVGAPRDADGVGVEDAEVLWGRMGWGWGERRKVFWR